MKSALEVHLTEEEITSWPGVQLDTSPIANGYRKLCWAIMIFAFVARLATKAMIYVDIFNIYPHFIS